MSRAELVSYVCLDCDRWIKAPAYARYAEAQRCPRCYRRRAEELARPILERFHQERARVDQPDLPF